MDNGNEYEAVFTNIVGTATSTAAALTVQPVTPVSISIVATAPSTVAVGGTLTCTLIVTNVSLATATGVTVTDTLPAGFNFISASGEISEWQSGSMHILSLGSMAAQAQATITIAGLVTAAAGGMITNTATVSGDQPPYADPAISTSTVTTQVTTGPSGTMLWTGKGDGTSWSDPNNWDTDTVPAAGNDVVIGPGANVTSTASVTIDRLQVQTGASLSEEGGMTIANGLTNSGTINAQPDGLTVQSGTLTVTGTLTNLSGSRFALNCVTINCPAVINQGAFLVVNGAINGQLTLLSGSTLLVGGLSASPFRVTGDFTNHGTLVLGDDPVYGSGTLIVSGGVLVNAADGTINAVSNSNTLDADLDNQGTINVDCANLAINQDAGAAASTLTNEQDGTINVGAGKTLTIGGQELSDQGVVEIDGNGMLHVATAQTTIAAQGCLEGSGTLTLDSGSFSLSSKSTIGALQVQSGATLNVGACALTVGNSLTNNGTISLAGTDSHTAYLVDSNGILVNQRGATIVLGNSTASSQLDQNNAVLFGQINNEGTVNVLAGGVQNINPPGWKNYPLSPDWGFNNDGTLHLASSGFLEIYGNFAPALGTVDGAGGLALIGAAVNLSADWSPAAEVALVDSTTVMGPGKLIISQGEEVDLVGAQVDADVENQGTLLVLGVSQAANFTLLASALDGSLTTFAGSTLIVGFAPQFLGGSVFSPFFSSTLPIGSRIQGLDATFTVANGFTNDGQIDLTAASSGSTIAVADGTLVNNGTITISNASDGQAVAKPTSTIDADVENRGTILLQANATVQVNGSLTINGQGTLQGQSTSTLMVTGSLLGNTAHATGFSQPGTVVLDGHGTSGSPQLLELMEPDQGDVPAGYASPLAYGSLQLGSGTYVELVDQFQNSPGNGAEVGYAGYLGVPAGATFDKNGLNFYAENIPIAVIDPNTTGKSEPTQNPSVTGSSILPVSNADSLPHVGGEFAQVAPAPTSRGSPQIQAHDPPPDPAAGSFAKPPNAPPADRPRSDAPPPEYRGHVPSSVAETVAQQALHFVLIDVVAPPVSRGEAGDERPADMADERVDAPKLADDALDVGAECEAPDGSPPDRPVVFWWWGLPAAALAGSLVAYAWYRWRNKQPGKTLGQPIFPRGGSGRRSSNGHLPLRFPQDQPKPSPDPAAVAQNAHETIVAEDRRLAWGGGRSRKLSFERRGDQ